MYIYITYKYVCILYNVYILYIFSVLCYDINIVYFNADIHIAYYCIILLSYEILYYIIYRINILDVYAYHTIPYNYSFYIHNMLYNKYIYIYLYINLPDMSQLPTSPFPKRGTSGPGNVFSTLC